MTVCTEGLPQLVRYPCTYINKSQGMTLSAGANITGCNHTLQQLITQLVLYKLELPGKVPKTEILIVYTNFCTGVVALVSPTARTINYHLVCFMLIWQFSM